MNPNQVPRWSIKHIEGGDVLVKKNKNRGILAECKYKTYDDHAPQEDNGFSNCITIVRP